MDYSSKKLFFFESSHVFVGVLIKTKTIPEYLFISAWYIWIIIVSRHIYWDWFRCFKKNNSNNKHIETTSYHIFTHRIYHSSILISSKCIIFAQFDTNFEEIKTVRTLFQLLHDPLIIFFFTCQITLNCIISSLSCTHTHRNIKTHYLSKWNKTEWHGKLKRPSTVIKLR